MTTYTARIPMRREDRRLIDKLAVAFSSAKLWGTRSSVVDIAIEFAHGTGLPRQGPVSWKNKGAEMEAVLERDYRVIGVDTVELGNLLYHGLQHYARHSKALPLPFNPDIIEEYVGTWMPVPEVREIWRRAFREGEDPRKVFDEEMNRDLDDVGAMLRGDTPMMKIEYPWLARTRSRYNTLDDLADANRLNISTLLWSARRERRRKEGAMSVVQGYSGAIVNGNSTPGAHQ